MTKEKRQRIMTVLKTAALALAITLFLVVVIAGNKKNTAKTYSREGHALKQRIYKLETALRDNREMLDEMKEANRTLREMLSELRGIHNDCQKNATDNFLREHRNQNAR